MKSLEELMIEEEYNDCRIWINKAREKKKTWNEILYACKENDEGLKNFIKVYQKIVVINYMEVYMSNISNFSNSNLGFLFRAKNNKLTSGDNEKINLADKNKNGKLEKEELEELEQSCLDNLDDKAELTKDDLTFKF